MISVLFLYFRISLFLKVSTQSVNKSDFERDFSLFCTTSSVCCCASCRRPGGDCAADLSTARRGVMLVVCPWLPSHTTPPDKRDTSKFFAESKKAVRAVSSRACSCSVTCPAVKEIFPVPPYHLARARVV